MRKTDTAKAGNEQHTPGIRVVLPRGMLARLDALVDRENGETRSIVIRRALKEHLERAGR